MMIARHCHTISVCMDLFYSPRKRFFQPRDVTFFELLGLRSQTLTGRALPLDYARWLDSTFTIAAQTGFAPESCWCPSKTKILNPKCSGRIRHGKWTTGCHTCCTLFVLYLYLWANTCCQENFLLDQKRMHVKKTFLACVHTDCLNGRKGAWEIFFIASTNVSQFKWKFQTL